MDQSYTDSDISMSPTQVLERLQILRQLQLMQRGKLQKQCLRYQETETSSSITEIISHFTNSTSYNTFRSSLQSPHDLENDDSSPQETPKKIEETDYIDGVSVLNLSQESEFVVNSPVSSQSSAYTNSKQQIAKQNLSGILNSSTEIKFLPKKNISLDDMPILTPKKDFEALIVEKLQHDKHELRKTNVSHENICTAPLKKPFLKRGEGMARFRLNRNALVIQNTKSLPWKQHKSTKTNNINIHKDSKGLQSNKEEMSDVQIKIVEPKQPSSMEGDMQLLAQKLQTEILELNTSRDNMRKQDSNISFGHSNTELPSNKATEKIKDFSKVKRPPQVNKGKTWAAILTKEQNDFLHQLKQSDYYKNFSSPAKSAVSDQSCDDNLFKLRQEREIAEQNMFELLEKKVTNESFNIENSFFNRFLKRNKHECSGESTPLMMQKCLDSNPDLLHILPTLKHKQVIDQTQDEAETCTSDNTECCSDICSSVSSCCSCKTIPQDGNANYSNNQYIEKNKNLNEPKRTNKTDKIKAEKITEKKKSQNSNVIDDEIMKANMVEMNTKLITTSELLKERLCELEDEIETFRKENANLVKLREEVDLDKQKFYEEKKAYEQKLNEEKILSEYYLSEEKEKLIKQKQIYERYVREIKGRLNKKEKEEVTCLKKEIEKLKEEMRIKDAKSTSTIARLRNQIKIIEKEKKDFSDEVDKLKKENKRIQHSNDITRRLTNMKHLAEINKKLTKMTCNDKRSEINRDSDVKYKAFEIERQSRSKKIQPSVKVRPRAKSVPNINVTSRYARYFSLRDSASHMDENKSADIDGLDTCASDNEESEFEDDEINNYNDREHENITSDNDNKLEKLYMDTFRSPSSKSSLSSINSYTNQKDRHNKPDDFFLQKRDSSSSSTTITKSPTQRSITSYTKSPIAVLNRNSSNNSPLDSHSCNDFVAKSSRRTSNSNSRTKSPLSVSSHSTQSQRSATVIRNSQHIESMVAVNPEPSTSKVSLTRTNLNPTEIKKSDGSKELRFPNGNIKHISADGKYSKFIYYNGDVKENFYNEGRIKYFYSETKTFHTTYADGLEVLEFPDGQVEKRYKDGSTEIHLPNGSIRYFDPKNKHVREEWRFPDGTALTISENGEQRVVFSNGQIEVHANDHKRREFPDGTVKLVYNDGTSETRYASGRVRIKDRDGNLIMDSNPR